MTAEMPKHKCESGEKETRTIKGTMEMGRQETAKWEKFETVIMRN